MTSALASSLDIGKATSCVRWTSVLKLMGAAFVALGVVCELVGELAGRAAEQTIESARDAEFARLADQIAVMRQAGGRLGTDAPLGLQHPVRALPGVGDGSVCRIAGRVATGLPGGPGP